MHASMLTNTVAILLKSAVLLSIAGEVAIAD